MARVMSKVCDILNKTVMTGNNVSHSNRKSRRRFLPNLQKTSMYSEILGQSISFKRVSTSAIRTVDHNGGLDEFLLSTPNSKLSKAAYAVKEKLLKKKASSGK